MQEGGDFFLGACAFSSREVALTHDDLVIKGPMEVPYRFSGQVEPATFEFFALRWLFCDAASGIFGIAK